jgi:hypothetical protein
VPPRPETWRLSISVFVAPFPNESPTIRAYMDKNLCCLFSAFFVAILFWLLPAALFRWLKLAIFSIKQQKPVTCYWSVADFVAS